MLWIIQKQVWRQEFKQQKIKPIDSRENITDYQLDEFVPIIVNKEYYFPTQRVIASKLNEKLYASRMTEKKSMTVSATLNTTNPNLSPILNLKNPKAILTTNRVESPSGLRADTEKQFSKLRCIKLW